MLRRLAVVGSSGCSRHSPRPRGPTSCRRGSGFSQPYDICRDWPASKRPPPVPAAAPAVLVSGPDPGETARRAATVAAQAFGDATMRLIYSEGARFGAGLRSGRFVARGEQLTLERVRFVDDEVVSGTGTFKASTGAVDATLTVAGVTVNVRWTQATPTATATIAGAVLSLPAP